MKFNIPQSPDIGQNSDRGISDLEISGQSFTKENCHNSRTSNDIDTKFEPVSKCNKRHMAILKKWMVTSCQQIVMSLSFFQFMANLE